MSAPRTAIRLLMDLRNNADARGAAVEADSKNNDRLGSESAFASRVWSRQTEALMLAVICEPPHNLDDALSVLSCLAELRDLHGTAGEESHLRDWDVQEMTEVAIQNCVAALAGSVVPQIDLPANEIDAFNWTFKQVARWLPTHLVGPDEQREA